VFGPEVGLLGLLLNAVAVAALWRFSAGAPKATCMDAQVSR